jgi:hypothetical protein
MIIIEDGSGKSDAQSYVDTTFVNAYFTLRGITYVSTDSHIINAMDYIESVYGQSFIGEKYTDTQSLSFPRLIEGVNTYPISVKNAVCELAYKASNGILMQDTEQRTIREKVGSIEVQYSEYADQQKQYSMVYQILSPYLSGSSVSHKVSRA